LFAKVTETHKLSIKFYHRFIFEYFVSINLTEESKGSDFIVIDNSISNWTNCGMI